MLFIPLPGTALLIPTPLANEPDKHHLHVLLTGAVGPSSTYGDREIVVVSVSSIKPKRGNDPSCLLMPGDHPCIIRPSFVSYNFARVVTVGSLQAGINRGEIKPRTTFDDVVFQRVLAGARSSSFTPRKIKAML